MKMASRLMAFIYFVDLETLVFINLTTPKKRIENSEHSEKVKTNRQSSPSQNENVEDEPNINLFTFNQPGNPKEK